MFDYAEYCYSQAQKGVEGKAIAAKLGWGSAVQVSYHSNTKNKLHPIAWQTARGLTRNLDLVNEAGVGLVNHQLTRVNWAERHFRALLSHLSPNGETDYTTARAALAVDLLPELEAEAKERQGVRTDLDIVEKIPPSDQGKARDQAAETMKTNGKYVSDAKRIKNDSPALPWGQY